jgi:hypothetical protein
MATVSKLLIRLQKFSSKISTTVDATESFNTNNSFYQDLSGWDSAVVQFVGTSGTINFSTTNDNGSITGQLLPAPEVPINWVSVAGVNLTSKADVTSIAASGIVAFGIIGNYLLLEGSGNTTTTTAAPTTTTTTATPTTTTTTATPTTTTTTAAVFSVENQRWGNTENDACTAVNPATTFYTTGPLQSGVYLQNGNVIYLDQALTQPVQYPYIASPGIGRLLDCNNGVLSNQRNCF